VKILRVGICGLGSMGMHHAMSLVRHPGVRLVAGADMEKKNRDRAARELKIDRLYRDGRELIRKEKPDVLWVCAPTYLHRELTCMGLAAGMHVFCEKPMAGTLRECEAMIRAEQASGKFLMIGQVLRFWPEYLFLKETVSDGRYGKLQTLSLLRMGGVSTGFQGWFLDEMRGGSQIFDRHIHDTDAVLWICGKPASVRVSADVRDRQTAGGAVHSFTEYEFPGGPLVHAEGSADMPAGYPFTARYHAVFERACVEFDSRCRETLTVYDGKEVFHPELPHPAEDESSGLNISSVGPYMLEQRHFLDCVRKGVPPDRVTPESAMETIRTAKAEMRSERTGRRVALR